VSVPAWSRLGDPFDVADLEWTVVEVADGGEEVRVVPRVRVRALHARLDAVLGIGGWSVSYAALGDAVACHLVIDGVTKGAVAPPAQVGGGAVTAAAALTLAAERFGVRSAWPEGAEAWVACDPETLEPLHPPDRPGHATGAAGDEGALDPAVPAVSGPAAEAPNGRHVAPATDAGDAVPPAHAAAPPAADPLAAPAPKPEGQQIIDKLIERLKAEGQGLAAARIMVRHGGYGKDPQAARELYGELRALLRAGAAEREPDGGAAAGGGA
jgi:hypothetical protein